MSLEHDRLLAWLSARGAAPTEAVKEACQVLTTRTSAHICLPWINLLDPLRRLGHVERDHQGRRWRVVTPTVFWRGEHFGRGLVCGARDQQLASTLSTQFGARFERSPNHNGPELWSLRGDRDKIQQLTRKLGFRWAPDCIEALFAALPTGEEALQSLPEKEYLACAFARRQWQKFTFSGTRPVWRWIRSERLSEIQGLVRSRESGQQEWWLWIERNGMPSDVDLASALSLMRARRLASLEHQRLARWSVIAKPATSSCLEHEHSESRDLRLGWTATNQQLEVPYFRAAPLPHLLERGLCLLAEHCPAEPVDEGGLGTITYDGVSHSVAVAVARILGIPLLERR